MALDPSRLVRAGRAAARHPDAINALLGVGVAVAYLTAVRMGSERNVGRPITAADVCAALLAAVLVNTRRRWPLPSLAATTVAAVVCIVIGGRMPVPVFLPVLVLCAYTVGSVSGRTTAWVAGIATAVSVYVAGQFGNNQGWIAPENLGTIAWTGMAVAVGDGLRTRRAYVAAVEERARRAEQSRDEEARRQVVLERLRIARELHDVVAHHIAMINVQAGVAAHVLRQQPEQAEEALRHVREAARTVIEELSTVLSVLRQPDDPETSDEPTRGLGRLSGLLDALAAAGLRVEHRQDGVARSLPASVDLAAFRIVQESLTNAQKHGHGSTVRLRLAYTAQGLDVVVENPVDAAVPVNGNGTGNGLTGMRERALAVGGTVRAGLDHGGAGFTVRAFLPSPQRPQEAS